MSTQIKQATLLSYELINELKAADTLLISAPMVNFGVLSSLKAWIDQIVRINHTFSYDGASFQGLVPVKRAVLAIAYGANGCSSEGDFAAMNFLEPYFISFLGFLGIQNIQVIRIEGTTGEAEALAATKEQALKQLSHLFIKEA